MVGTKSRGYSNSGRLSEGLQEVSRYGGFAVNFYYFFEVKSGAKSLLMDRF